MSDSDLEELPLTNWFDYESNFQKNIISEFHTRTGCKRELPLCQRHSCPGPWDRGLQCDGFIPQ